MKTFMQSLILLVLTAVLWVNVVSAQMAAVPVECGAIVEGELAPGQEGAPPLASEYHKYILQLAPGDSVTMEIRPIGSAPDTFMRLFDPGGALIANTGWGRGNGQADKIENYIVSAHGTYTIGVGASTVGAYVFSVGCLPRGGTLINPGDNISYTRSSPAPESNSASGSFTYGFSGLPPVDFSSALLFPFNFNPDQPNGGTIPPNNNTIIGFTFNASAGQRFDMNFSRPSGNLNLGVVVLSPTNKVVFQASLISTDILITRFGLQESGQHTIGVFQINLDPPVTPQATAFQVTGTVN